MTCFPMTHPAGLAVVCVAALTCDPLALVTLTTQDTLTSLQTRSEGAHVCLEQIKHEASEFGIGFDCFYLSNWQNIT